MVSHSRTMDGQLLKVFAIIAQYNGITAAADALGIAKSAVSKQLDALEGQLQVRLFERTSRKIALTREGRALLPRAQSILAELDQLMLAAQEEHVRIQGTVRIAASPEFGAFITANFLPLLLQRHPDLKVIMALEYRRDDLHDPDFDLALRIGTVGDERLVARYLGDFARVLVCSPGFASAHAISVPGDLEQVNALLFSANEMADDWALQHPDQPEQRQQIRVTGNFAARGFGVLTAAAIAGMGVARLPYFVAAPEIQGGRLSQVLPTWQSPPAPVHLAYRPGISRIGRVNATIEAILAEVPKLLAAMGP